MLKAVGDIWTYAKDAPICIPTNGQINGSGRAIMGKGLAEQAATKFPDLPYLLAQRLEKYGNRVYIFKVGKVPPSKIIITVPTKDEWAKRSTLALVRKSCLELRDLQQALNLKNVLVPLLGCGAGKLPQDYVLGIMENLLDDAFTLITLEPLIETLH